ncbi:MAG TPA: class I adenylate-forming enzyme family protein [Burkholderiales bacterium]
MIRTELIAPIPELLRRHARARPDKLAYSDAAGDIDYATLEASTANLASQLQALGIEAGARVALLLPNSIEWVQGCLAIARAGAISVPIAYEAALPEITYRLTDAGCRVLITTDEQMARLEPLLAGLPELGHLILASRGARHPRGHRLAEFLSRPARGAPRDPAMLDTPAFIIYTSGTTGRAKGVVLSVRGMLWITAACWTPVAGLCESDRVLSPLPLFHSYALNLSVLSILATGASEHILERFSTQAVLAQLATGRFTVLPGVPTMFHYLLEAGKAAGVAALPGLRVCITAGAIMPAALNDAFEAQFGVPLLDGYGITETSTMVTMNWLHGTRVPGSCGLPVPGLAVRIIDPASGLDVDPGAEGELIVRGPNLMSGYYRQPEATAAALRNGWYHTGDLARSDPNGYLTITGRLKELIIRGGQNIAPAEVEEAVRACAGVLDCAVFGVPHEKLGEVPVACVVVREGETVDPEALIAHCRAQLSAYKVPAEVHFTDAIPRTGSGKTMRYKLRDALLAKRAGAAGR